MFCSVLTGVLPVLCLHRDASGCIRDAADGSSTSTGCAAACRGVLPGVRRAVPDSAHQVRHSGRSAAPQRRLRTAQRAHCPWRVCRLQRQPVSSGWPATGRAVWAAAFCPQTKGTPAALDAVRLRCRAVVLCLSTRMAVFSHWCKHSPLHAVADCPGLCRQGLATCVDN